MKLSHGIRIKMFPSKIHGLWLTSGLSVTTFIANWQEWSLIESTGLSLTMLPHIDKRCVSLDTVISHWHVSLIDNSGPSLTTGVCYWKQWSIFSNRFPLLTTVVSYWQQVSLIDNNGISLTTVFLYTASMQTRHRRRQLPTTSSAILVSQHKAQLTIGHVLYGLLLWPSLSMLP
jgi:hypothetical protein